MKKLLCIVSRAPYDNTHSLELIEAAMVGAVFDFQVSILFRDEGIWCLLKNQDASPLRQRTLAKVLTALPTYDVQSIYVCADAMTTRGLQPVDFVTDVEILELPSQTLLVEQQDAVMGAQS